MRLDLPEPETPVTHVMRPIGISTVTSARLCALRAARADARARRACLRFAGIGMRFFAGQVRAR